jgi:hypothetical protein
MNMKKIIIVTAYIAFLFLGGIVTTNAQTWNYSPAQSRTYTQTTNRQPAVYYSHQAYLPRQVWYNPYVQNHYRTDDRDYGSVDWTEVQKPQDLTYQQYFWAVGGYQPQQQDSEIYTNLYNKYYNQSYDYYQNR